jgi:hypothetical protein
MSPSRTSVRARCQGRRQTYHVTGLSTGASEDEDCLRAAAGTTLLELIPSASTELADFKSVCFWGSEGDGRGCCQAGKYGEGEKLHVD